MMRRLLLLAIVLGACSTVAKITTAPATAVGRLLLPPEEERRLGDQLAAEVAQKEKILDDPQVKKWVDEVGARIVGGVPKDDQGFPFDFQVIDDPGTVNAFALPGGHIFIYSGLILAADDEAEVAAVLGHEVAHVTLDHPSQQLAAAMGADVLRSIALGFEPGLVNQLATGIAAQGYMAAYSRQDEAEADRYGLSYLAAAGYDPEAMVSFFRKLERLQGQQPNLVEKFFASHPDPGQRVESLQSLIRTEGLPKGRTSIVGGFDEIKRRLQR